MREYVLILIPFFAVMMAMEMEKIILFRNKLKLSAVLILNKEDNYKIIKINP